MSNNFNKKDYYEQVRIRFTSFITTVIKNTAINYKKRISNRINHEIEYNENIKEESSLQKELTSFFSEHYSATKLENYFSNEEHYNTIRKLSKTQKEVLYYRYIKNLKYSEISKIMRIAENNVRAINSRALIKIRKGLKKYKKDE